MRVHRDGHGRAGARIVLAHRAREMRARRGRRAAVRRDGGGGARVVGRRARRRAVRAAAGAARRARRARCEAERAAVRAARARRVRGAAAGGLGHDVRHALARARVVDAELLLELPVLGCERLGVDVLPLLVVQRLLEQQELVELVPDVEVRLVLVRRERGRELLGVEPRPVDAREPRMCVDVLQALALWPAAEPLRRITCKKLKKNRSAEE
jgi:hypothetical protein